MKTDDVLLVLAAATLILELGGFVVGAVWVVGKIQTSTERLGVSIDSLTSRVAELRETVKGQDAVLDDHSTRLVRLEARGCR